MIPVPSGVRVWIAVGHTDMRCGMNSLALRIQQSLRRDPHICVGRDYVSASPKEASFQVDSRKRSYIRTHHLRFGLGRLRTIIAAFAS